MVELMRKSFIKRDNVFEILRFILRNKLSNKKKGTISSVIFMKFNIPGASLIRDNFKIIIKQENQIMHLA